jgi:hypothetical protein
MFTYGSGVPNRHAYAFCVLRFDAPVGQEGNGSRPVGVAETRTRDHRGPDVQSRCTSGMSSWAAFRSSWCCFVVELVEQLEMAHGISRRPGRRGIPSGTMCPAAVGRAMCRSQSARERPPVLARSLCSRSFWGGDVERVQQSADELVGADQVEHVDDPVGSEQVGGLVVE